MVGIEARLELINKRCNVLRYFLSKQDVVIDYYYSLKDKKPFLEMLDKGEYKAILKEVLGGNDLKIRELQAIARRAGVAKYSHMSKETLKERLIKDGLL